MWYKTMNTFFPRIILVCLVLFMSAHGQVKRSRNEGTFNIPASNVIGNGNIVVSGVISGKLQDSQVGTNPWISITTGIANILQLSGRFSMVDFKRPGGMEGRLQLTMPGNDRLRFFGMSISGELYLSAEMDTLSGTAATGRPDYNAYVRPSLTADLDWIALSQKIPLKTYLLIGFADNSDLLHRYSQIALRLGIELKFERNSYALDIGSGFYKEKSRSLEGYDGDHAYLQQRLWIEPSMRYRLFDRFSLIVSVRALVMQRVKTVRPLEPEYLKLSVGIETPIVFRETNCEAIRTMMFIEHNKNVPKDSAVITSSTPKGATDSLEITIDGLNLEQITDESEAEMLKRREEIRSKMEEIEKLLEDIE